MNRRKKIIQKLTKKAKQAQAKKQQKNKTPYISKADRADMENSAQDTVENQAETESEKANEEA